MNIRDGKYTTKEEPIDYHDIRLISKLWHWKICYLATSTQMPTTWLNVKCYSLVCICCYSRQPVLHDNMHRFKFGWQGLYQVFTTVVQIFYQQVTIDKVCYKLLWWNQQRMDQTERNCGSTIMQINEQTCLLVDYPGSVANIPAQNVRVLLKSSNPIKRNYRYHTNPQTLYTGLPTSLRETPNRANTEYCDFQIHMEPLLLLKTLAEMWCWYIWNLSDHQPTIHIVFSQTDYHIHN